MHSRRWLPFAMGALLTACLPLEESPPSPTAVPAQVSPARDVGALFDDSYLAFRDADGVLTASSTFQRVRVTDGAFTVTPRAWQDGIRLEGPPIQFATASIVHGDRTADIAVRSTSLAGGSVAIDRGAAVETLTNREDGLEQSWHFAAAPAEAGDLIISVDVRGSDRVAINATGVHFLSSDGPGLRVTHAVWVDAAESSWTIPLAWEDGILTMIVPTSVVEHSVYPAVLDPTISAELGMDVPVAGTSAGRGREPAVAWNGTQHLAVWRDDRLGRETEIYGARVAANGVVIDKYGFAIATEDLPEAEPVVTWTGSEWLVAWIRDAGDGGDIAAATVSTASPPVVTSLGNVAATAEAESAPSLGSDGSGALLTWVSGDNVRGAFFSMGGFAAPFDIAATTEIERTPTVAGSSGGDYLVAWQQRDDSAGDIHGQLVNSATGLNGTEFTISATTGGQNRPAAAFDGTNYLVAWRDRGDIWAARISTTGTVLDNTANVGGVAVSAVASVEQTYPAVACDASSCLIAWQDRRDNTDPDVPAFDAYGQRIGFDMSLQGGEIAISTEVRNQFNIAVSGRSSGFLVAWEDFRTGIQTAMASRVSGAGAVLDTAGVILNQATKNGQRRPALARSSTTRAVVWSDSRAFGSDIMERIFESGVTHTVKAVSSAANDQSEASVAWDGSQYLTVWQDARDANYDIYGARFTETGSLTDASGFAISTAARVQLAPDVASDGAGLSLVVWVDRRNLATGYDLMGALVSGSTVTVNDIPICQGMGDQLFPAVTWDPTGGVFVVAWADTRSDVDGDIYAARVQPGGTVIDSCGVAVQSVVGGASQPDIAASGTQLLVVWEDSRNDLNGDVYAARLDTNGALNVSDANGVAIAEGASGQGAVAVVGVSDNRWGLAWVDDVNEAVTGTDIYGNTMQATGTLEGPHYLISGATEYETNPAFQSGTNTRPFANLAYHKVMTALGGFPRVRYRQLKY